MGACLRRALLDRRGERVTEVTKPQETHTFAIMGSGNVASHLAPSLTRAGWRCRAVWSRSEEHAADLASKVAAESTSDCAYFYRLLQEDPSVELLLLCLTDDGLSDVAKKLPPKLTATVVHTSGSTPMSVLSGVPSYGVLYPVQTFSKSRALDMSRVPLLLEWSDPQAESLLRALADALGSEDVRQVTSEERGRLHLAACFGCNFVNHLLAVAQDLLRETPLSLSDMRPLIEETISKAMASDDPATLQTGPAIRHDESTLQRHQALLNGDPRLNAIYQLMTHSIQERAEKS